MAAALPRVIAARHAAAAMPRLLTSRAYCRKRAAQGGRATRALPDVIHDGPTIVLPEPPTAHCVELSFYRLESELEGLLERSFPDPADVAQIRRLIEDSLANDGLGLGTRRAGARIRFAYPTVIAVSSRRR